MTSLISVVVVLGAGGQPGGRFIDGTLAELESSTGFRLEHASSIIGTSVGAFRAAGAGPEVPLPTDVGAALSELGEPPPQPGVADGMIGSLRVVGARLLARFVPRSRPPPSWRAPNRIGHSGVSVVTVDLDRRARAVHRLTEVDDPAAAIRASAAVPFATGPVLFDGGDHSDGALWSPNSVDLVPSSESTLVIVVAPMVPTRPRTLLQRLHERQLRAELGSLHPSSSVLLIRP